MSREIVGEIVRQHWKNICKKKNVVGYEMVLKPRIKNGIALKDTAKVFRVYVTEKLPMSKLSSKDLLPMTLSTGDVNVAVDVVAVGEVYAPPKGIIVEADNNPTKKHRPVVFGVSVGNKAITAGTLGWAFARLADSTVLWGSNAHVFCDNPGNSSIIEKKILQPGTHDGGTDVDHVANYVWHQQVLSGGIMDTVLVPVAGFIAKYFNMLANAVGAEVRLEVVAKNSINHMDFAVAEPIVDWKYEMLGLDVDDYQFVGLGFAGSDTTGIFCKVQYMAGAGYLPVDVEMSAEIMDGDMVVKCGRTSGFTSGKVIGSSAYMSVSYGDFTAIFEDVVIVEGQFLQPGDSGSAVWRKK